MRRSRLRPGEVPTSYRWYDRRSGAIDLAALAVDSMTGAEGRPALEQPPEWIRGLDLPACIPGATLSDLARVSGVACRAWVEAGRPGRDGRVVDRGPSFDLDCSIHESGEDGRVVDRSAPFDPRES